MSRIDIGFFRLASIALLALALAACARSAGAPEAPPTGSNTQAPSASIDAASTSTPASGAAATPPLTPAPAATAATPAASTAGTITISAVGDISLARQVVDRMQANGGAYPYALIAPLVDGDIGFANLEGALTERGEPWPKGYNFRTPPRFAPGLFAAHFDVVTLANNHMLDYGVIGLQDTIATLDAVGIKHAGAGGSIAQAAFTPAIVEAHGLRVAFVACVLTPTEGGGFDIHAWGAGEGAPGIAVCDAQLLRDAIAGARKVADFVVVAVHAGTEYDNAPNATQRELADVAMRAGADVFLGAHAHVVQPVERRGAQLIAWGLGNFIFDLDNADLANIPRPRVSLILDVTLAKGAGVTSYRVIPVTQDEAEDRPRPATPEEAAVLRQLTGPGGESGGP
jgi:poly-gamma-glutamate synthesis protein (capsule biosynthesis protein)